MKRLLGPYNLKELKKIFKCIPKLLTKFMKRFAEN